MHLTLQDVIPEYISLEKEACMTQFILSLYKPLKGTKGDEILHVLYQSDIPWKMHELQAKVGLTQYKYYEELARLEGAGFIERKRNLLDQRITEVYITSLGKFVFQSKEV